MHLHVALNHTGGPGWLLRAELDEAGTPRRVRYERLCGAPITSLEISADGSLLAAGNSEGEASLASLTPSLSPSSSIHHNLILLH